MQSYVLMIKTDPDDQLITDSTWKELGLQVPIHYVNEISDVDQLIIEKGEPSLILQNDQGPFRGGINDLLDIKRKKELAHIPVVMLGEIASPDYIRDCYRAGVNSYITKPSNISLTKEKISSFIQYWSRVAEVL